MKNHRIFLTSLAIVVMACLFGGHGQFQEQYVTPSSGYSAIAQSAAQDPISFSQFYVMTPGPAPNSPIGAPQPFEIAGNVPSTLYLGEQMYPVPYSQYQSDPVPAGANSLWVKGITNWTQYAAIPQGATVALLAVSPTGGNGTLNYVDSSGQTYSHNYFFYPISLLNFYADTIGRHMLSTDINGQSSNQVVIDVVGTYKAPAYYDPSSYYAWYYPDYWDYYYYCDYPSCDHHQDDHPHDGNQHDGNQHDGNQHDGNQHDGNQHDGNQHDGNQHDGGNPTDSGDANQGG
jgi:hypothetical protein